MAAKDIKTKGAVVDAIPKGLGYQVFPDGTVDIGGNRIPASSFASLVEDVTKDAYYKKATQPKPKK